MTFKFTGKKMLTKFYGIEGICYAWLFLVAWLHIIGGIALCLDWPEQLWQTYYQELYKVFNLTQGNNSNVDLIIEMLTRLFGPTIASWGVILFALLTFSFKYSSSKTTAENYQRNKNLAINFIIAATLIWFILDTTISLQFSMYLHLGINLIAAFSILIPLFYLKFR